MDRLPKDMWVQLKVDRHRLQESEPQRTSLHCCTDSHLDEAQSNRLSKKGIGIGLLSVVSECDSGLHAMV